MNPILNQLDLKLLEQIAVRTLDELVTEEGIYASSSKGAEGVYHGFFGRDTIITASLIVQAEDINRKFIYTKKAVNSVLRLANWQGKLNDPATGQEKGKIPHEVRTNPADYWHLTQGAILSGGKPWYVDPDDLVLKNWDSLDATPMWVWAVGNFYEMGLIPESQMPWKALKSALKWCVQNLKEYHGLAGFNYDPNREFGGLYTMTWKDSHAAYLSEQNGKILCRPIYDVWASGLFWAALASGQKMFAQIDDVFSHKLKTLAGDLKTRFNTMNQGFVMLEENGQLYIGECLDSRRQLQKAVCIDPALCLYSNVDGTSVIYQDLAACLAERVMKQDMFDPQAGVRVYSQNNSQFDPLGYHRGPNTFWPFVSALTAKGLIDYGFNEKAEDILIAMLNGVQRFGTSVELFMGQNGNYERYHDLESGNFSCSDQAWTASGVYFALAYLASCQRKHLGSAQINLFSHCQPAKIGT
jgi:glycogen debranching enzyme